MRAVCKQALRERRHPKCFIIYYPKHQSKKNTNFLDTSNSLISIYRWISIYRGLEISGDFSARVGRCHAMAKILNGICIPLSM